MKAIIAKSILIAACAVPVFAATPDRATVTARYNRLPLSFEQNRGQADAQAKFLSRGRGYTMLLGQNEVDLRLARQGSQSAANVKMTFRNASAAPLVTGAQPLPGKVNYLIGNDSSQWRTNVPTFARVQYRGLYPGIDLVYYGNQQQLEYDLVVAPNADPNQIRLAFDGIASLRVDGQGDLVLQTAGGEIKQFAPVVYQEIAGVRKELAGRYEVTGSREVAFRVADYDARQPLVIDPVLVYATFLGGGDNDDSWAIAVDSSGNAYVAGQTNPSTSGDTFPVTTGVKPLGGLDAFVCKFSANGSSLVYSTFVGGSSDDIAYAIAVDGSGNAYITGATLSSNFPIKNGFQTTYGGAGSNGFGDAFIAELNSTGSSILYSSYIGGTDDDSGNGIALDGTGNAYVTGGTVSTGGFPTTSSAYSTTNAGGRDIFLTKVNPALSGAASLLYSTYIGGTGDEEGFAIGLDNSNNAYLTGYTTSSNLPTTSGAYKTALTTTASCMVQPEAFSCGSVFVSKVNPSSSGKAGLVYSTYLGGSSDQTGYGIAADSSGNAVVAGDTSSTDFPVSSGAYQAKGTGSCTSTVCTYDAFVTKLNSTGSSLVYSTFLGGTNDDHAFALDLDSTGNIYIAGETNSTNFPTSAGAVQGFSGATTCTGGTGCYPNYIAFVAMVNPAASGAASLVSSTYLGGSGSDYANGIAVTPSGTAYVTGVTDSLNFPVTGGAYKIAFGTCDNTSTGGSGCDRSFVAELTFSPEVPPAPFIYLNGYVNAASSQVAYAAPGDFVSIYGKGIGPSTPATLQVGANGNVVTTLGGTQVLFNGTPAPLIFVSSGQVNAVVPFEVIGQKTATVQVISQGNSSNTLVLPVATSDLGIFTQNSQGTGPGAVLNVDYSLNTAANPVARGSYIFVYLTGAGQTTPAGQDGKVESSGVPPAIAAPISVTLGTVAVPAANIQYSGVAPSGIDGFYQINILIPSNAPTGGAVPLLISEGKPVTDTNQTNSSGASLVTVAIK
jgi:uncharacterized protein (TIGR03437 family)